MDVRKPGMDPPVCMNGKGLGSTFGVWLSINMFLGRDGEFLLPALVRGLSCNAGFAGVESRRLPLTTLLGVDSITLSDCRPECARLDASPVAGVGAIEEFGPDSGSAMVDADP